jgi:hypothetical protein
LIILIMFGEEYKFPFLTIQKGISSGMVRPVGS